MSKVFILFKFTALISASDSIFAFGSPVYGFPVIALKYAWSWGLGSFLSNCFKILIASTPFGELSPENFLSSAKYISDFGFNFKRFWTSATVIPPKRYSPSSGFCTACSINSLFPKPSVCLISSRSLPPFKSHQKTDFRSLPKNACEAKLPPTPTSANVAAFHQKSDFPSFFPKSHFPSCQIATPAIASSAPWAHISLWRGVIFGVIASIPSLSSFLAPQSCWAPILFTASGLTK